MTEHDTYKGNGWQDVTLLKAQRLLDRYFQRVLAVVEERSTELYKKLAEHGSGVREIEEKTAEEWLTSLVNDVYRQMGDALFYALPLVQPEDFGEAGQILNFYFWPGYRTRSLNEQPRLYYVDKPDPRYIDVMRKVGVGLCGRADSETEKVDRYHQCCQARWYHYATAHPGRPMRHPGSVYRWFVEQTPRISKDRYDYLHSFSVQIAEHEGAIESHLATSGQPHEILTLPRPSSANETRQWGEQVAAFINEMTTRLFVKDPAHRFPDRIKRASILPQEPGDQRPEPQYRRTRCMLISLWMHSVFCSFTPLEWKDELMKALEEVDLEDTMRWIENAKVDQWANDWGDQLAHPDRPLFRDWTTISLYPGASQPLNEGVSQPQAVGSAILLSSVRLKPRYIAMVRPWIRSVYGLLLGVDAAIQTHNRNVELAKRNAQSLALVAGPWIGHEITNIFKTTFGRVAYEMDSSDPEAVRLRKQAWDTLRVITQLSDLVGKAVTRGSIKEEIELIRKRFIEPLAREMAKGQQRLVDAIFAVARQVYENARRGDARIPELENRNSGRCRDIEDIDADVYGHGLVLVHEMIANFRSHTRRPDPDAHFTVSCDGRRLTITLEARSEGQKFESESFKLLGFFFETAGVGKAVLQWFEEEKRYRYKIDVSVREEEHHETATSPSRVTGQ